MIVRLEAKSAVYKKVKERVFIASTLPEDSGLKEYLGRDSFAISVSAFVLYVLFICKWRGDGDL